MFEKGRIDYKNLPHYSSSWNNNPDKASCKFNLNQYFPSKYTAVVKCPFL
jgi:hypothetical protein